MKIKILTPNENDKIELTPKELQELVDNAYEEGYNDGQKTNNNYYYPYHPYYDYPYYLKTPTINATPYITWSSTNTKGE